MDEAAELLRHPVGAIVAPAGHGKTELIVKTAAMGRRTLILTHTHAGVHAICDRLKRLGVARSAVYVDTVAGWSMKYAGAFPATGQPPAGAPISDAQWQQVYRGGAAVLDIPAVRQVVEASYDRVLVDEYQDCNDQQHQIAIKLAGIVPTLIFGDPMQGIFEFAGSRLSWTEDVYPHFPLIMSLNEPRRWEGKNEALGSWIFQVRGQLERGEVIDLAGGPATFLVADNAYDGGLFFDDYETREGTVAAIHCRRGACNQLARMTRGAYQAIEEVGGARLRAFALSWDEATPAQKVETLTALIGDCCDLKALEPGEVDTPETLAAEVEIVAAWVALGTRGDAPSARQVLAGLRRHGRMRIYRRELWRDADRALSDLESGRTMGLGPAAVATRQRASASGRSLYKRTVSTPLLLKGLEFDHVLVPDASHFGAEDRAQAKLFYVAISRATRSLTISAPSRHLFLPAPLI